MGCYRTILAAIDGSPDAAAALRHATSLARDQHAKLVVLTVAHAPPPQVIGPGTMVTTPIDPDVAFGAILREAVDALPLDIGVEARLAHGRPARRILEVAEEIGCDLIVMGFHGHGRLHHALIGSTSDSVLRESHLPVLLMRAAAPGAAPEPAGSAAAS